MGKSADLYTLQKFENQSADKKVQVGNDQEKVQSERDSHSENRGGRIKGLAD